MKNKIISRISVIAIVGLLFASIVGCEKNKVAVSGVSLDKTTLSVEVGKTSQLTATVAPGDAEDKTVTWKSSDATIASVSATGLVKGEKVSATAVTITVTTKDGAKTANCAVTVTPDPGAVTGVKLAVADKADVQLAVDGTKKINPPTVEPATATDKTVKWSSRDETIASVGTDGTVTAKKLGVVYILVSANSDATKKDSVKVSVVVPITSITFKQPSLNIRKSSTYTLQDAIDYGYLAIEPADAKNRETPIVTSSTASVTVDQATKTLRATGEIGTEVAVITVSSHFTAAPPVAPGTIKVNITTAPVAGTKITSIKFNPITKTVKVGEEYSLAQAIQDGILTIKPPTYDEKIFIVTTTKWGVVVDSDGKKFVAKAVGDVTLKVTNADFTIFGEIVITVKP